MWQSACTTLPCRQYESFMIWLVSWKVAVIMACEATMAASTATTSDGKSMLGGMARKKGFSYASGYADM